MNCFGLTEKTCRRCRRTFPVEQFAVTERLSPLCRECQATPLPRMRECRSCGRVIPVALFPRAKKGHRHLCSQCGARTTRRCKVCGTPLTTRYTRLCRNCDLARMRWCKLCQKALAVGNSPFCADCRSSYLRTYYREYQRRERMTERGLARVKATRAVKRGKLIRPLLCESCGIAPNGKPLHAHHPDYSKPFDVVWLCIACHWLQHGRVDRAQPRRTV